MQRLFSKISDFSQGILVKHFEPVHSFRLMAKQLNLHVLQSNDVSRDTFGPGLKFDAVLAILFLSCSQTRLACCDEIHGSIQFFGCHASSQGITQGL